MTKLEHTAPVSEDEEGNSPFGFTVSKNNRKSQSINTLSVSNFDPNSSIDTMDGQQHDSIISQINPIERRASVIQEELEEEEKEQITHVEIEALNNSQINRGFENT